MMRGFMLMGLLLLSAAAGAEQRLLWNREPIPVTLVVGQEQTLLFPDHVKVGIPQALLAPDQKAMESTSTAGAVLWKALQPFPAQRLQVLLKSTGLTLLFDVTAVVGQGGETPPEALRIQIPARYVASPEAPATSPADAATAAADDAEAISPIALTRFAAQQLYAPSRLLKAHPAITRVPMKAPRQLPRLLQGGAIQAFPVASWRGGGWYVTAVKLVNTGATPHTFDPRALRGRFAYATAQHQALGPHGSETDTTSLYLVTERPFGGSLEPGGLTP